VPTALPPKCLTPSRTLWLEVKAVVVEEGEEREAEEGRGAVVAAEDVVD
jgi:hypothetical protein